MQYLTSISYLRAFSMLYIVGYWHLFDYADFDFGQSTLHMQQITHTILALFVFISGYLLGGLKRLSAIEFYKRRFLRIYPLYMIAVAVFYFYGINDGWVSVKALLSVAMYTQPAPLTLWFVSMLVLFYLVAPMLLALVDKAALFLAVAGAMFVGTLVFHGLFATVDIRVLLYFPSFCLGIFCASHGATNRWINPKTALTSLAIGFLLIFLQSSTETLSDLKFIPLLASGAYLIFWVALRYENQLQEYRLISLLSYSSFAMYLFHRPIFTSVTSLYLPDTWLLQVLYLATVGLLSIAAISWGVQWLYDISHRAVRGHLQHALAPT